MVIAHHCDNPPCIRPDHLFLTTHAGNTADMMAKSRDRHVVGEAHGMAKLTTEQVTEIRARWATKPSPRKGVSIKDLATEYGVSQAQISRIAGGTRW